ncbi:hypothetical protein J4225_04210 [Candidatus Pacearchaeota archaeon]|nr:hypothetical protein [Candidatus Pacearchaeota archaeon]
MTDEFDGSDTIFLEHNELKLFNFLKSRTSEQNNWPSFGEIAKKLKTSEPEAKKLISSVRKKGVVLDTEVEVSGRQKIRKFALAPEMLGCLIRETTIPERKKSTIHTTLMLSEPCFGTKAYEPLAMKGLILALDVNGISQEIDEVTIQGGIIPHIPPFSSVLYVNDARFLGYVDRKPGEVKGFAEELLEDKLNNDFESLYYEKHVNNEQRRKITKLTDAFEAAGKEVEGLMSGLRNDAVLRIQLGEEDYKNMKHLEQAYIRKWADEKKQRIKEETEDTLGDIKCKLTDSLESLIRKKCIGTSLGSKKLKTKPDEKGEEYKLRVVSDLYNIAAEARDELMFQAPGRRDLILEIFTEDMGIEMLTGKQLDTKEISPLISDISKYLFRQDSSKTNKEVITKKQNKIAAFKKVLSETEKERQGLESRLKDLDNALSWTEQLLRGQRAPISFFTGQYPIFSDELEVIFKKVKDDYTSHFFAWGIDQQPVVHVSSRKRIAFKTGVINNIKTGEKEIVQLDYEVHDSGVIKKLLIHNLRHTFSDAVSPRSIKDAKLLLNHERIVLKKLYETEIAAIQPDLVILGAHQAGGFRAMPWFKEPDLLLKEEPQSSYGLSWVINLPVFQSIPKLEWLVAHNFKNWHTKRYQTGPFASGAVVHSRDKEGVDRFTVFDIALLTEFGKIAEEINIYRTALNHEKNETKKKELRNLIRGARVRVKANFKKIEVTGDQHLGAPTELARISNIQYIEAAQSYQRRHGLPDLVTSDELLHGVEENVFKSGSRYLALNPEDFLQIKVQPILDNKEMSQEKKTELVVKEAIRNQRAITIHNRAEQLNLFDRVLKPYLNNVLRKGGQVILCSGNHDAHSNRAGDEALELSMHFDAAYRREGRILAFDGKGNDFGVGVTRLNGKANQLLFLMHKFPERQDEIYGIMSHMRKMGHTADIAIGGDRHQPGIGYADSRLVILHPGQEGINKYVPVIGKPAGVHGFMNVLYDPDKRGVYAVECIHDPTLEKVIRTENII